MRSLWVPANRRSFLPSASHFRMRASVRGLSDMLYLLVVRRGYGLIIYINELLGESTELPILNEYLLLHVKAPFHNPFDQRLKASGQGVENQNNLVVVNLLQETVVDVDYEHWFGVLHELHKDHQLIFGE